MSVYRLSADAELSVPASPERRRTPIILGVSALLHVALLGASALFQPKAPPPPREVDVMKWEAVELENGELAWKSGGIQRARVRSDPAAQ